jgi:superfamily II DNA or RNA helicase
MHVPDLRDLRLSTTYHKGQDDIAEEFYLPCMSCATRYDRAVGFFSSTIYILAWHEIKDFVARNGRMRIICSPVLSREDIDALRDGYTDRFDEALAKKAEEDINRLLGDPFLRKPATVLASLVASEVIDVRLAFLVDPDEGRTRRIFHDKLGLFFDANDDAVAFRGSMNETWSGLSSDGNLESVDVFVSWEGSRERDRVHTEIKYFDQLWDNDYPAVVVRSFPSVSHDYLISAADREGWPCLVEEICEEIDLAERLAQAPDGPRRTLRPHQSSALSTWLEMGRRGILEHATGSGKTFTALCAIRESLSHAEVPVVLVPSDLLLTQWHDEITSTLTDPTPDVLLCGGGNDRWRQESLLRPWTRHRPDGSRPRLVLSTMQTACTDAFLGSISDGEHLFLVADELHRIGSTKHRRTLSLNAGPRLGLSATPHRYGDPVGTSAIFDFFGGLVAPPFTLYDAIPEILTPYFYYVHQLHLSETEQAEWDELSEEVKRLYARVQQGGGNLQALEQRIHLLLIRRARIPKSAEAKIPLALEVISRHYAPGQKWILYCDSLQQLRPVYNQLRDAGYAPNEYHYNMAGDRKETLRHFDTNGGILVSIRCLDEGVDIPSVTHALVLASSKNPREFIQRRGRILRKAPGKSFAHLHDAVVVPQRAGDEPPGLAILENELARAIEFGMHAENPSSITDLERIAASFGLGWQNLVQGGLEDDDTDK